MVRIKESALHSLSKSQLIVLVMKLFDEIELLKVRIIELEEKLSEKGDSTNQKNNVPLWIKPSTKTKAKHKRKQRRENFVRTKDDPTHHIFHSYETCPNCNSENLGKPSVAYSRQIIDIPVVSATITQHTVFKRHCFSCKKRVYPTLNLTPYVFGKYRVGISLMALVTTMREEERLPIKTIQNHLKTFYHLDLSTGEIVKILHTTALWGKPQYQAIRENLLSSSVIHADETGGRENGKNGYFWNFSNNTHQFLLYRKSRGSKVVREVLGEDGSNFEGVLTTDFYTAYNEYAGFHQRCWVHYLRDMKELSETYPKDKLLKTWSSDIKTLYGKAKQYTGPPNDLPIGLQEQMRERKEVYFKKQLTDICSPYLEKQTVFSTLNARALKYISELFTFIRFPNISPDNNSAERILRHTVVSRKISGGTRSPKGSETKSILASLFGTWRLQNLNPFEQTKNLLLEASCQRA